MSDLIQHSNIKLNFFHTQDFLINRMNINEKENHQQLHYKQFSIALNDRLPSLVQPPPSIGMTWHPPIEL